jgi:hypothetical protein
MNRDGGIRTRDPLNPIQVRYRAALRPVRRFRGQTEEYSRGAASKQPRLTRLRGREERRIIAAPPPHHPCPASGSASLPA